MATRLARKGVSLNNDARQHMGPNVTMLKEFSGIAPNGAFTVKVDTGNRKHGLKLFCAAVNYTGGAGQATTKITGAGNDALTVTLTLSAGREPNAVAIVNGGAGYAQNDRFTVVDATGTGAIFNVDTVGGGGAVTAASYVAGTAAASPVEPDFFFTSLDVSIGNAHPYQVDPIFYVMRQQACKLWTPLGVLPVDFTDPTVNEIDANDETAWDTVGAKQMTLTGRISPNVVKPQLTGQEAWDALRNFYNGPGPDDAGRIVNGTHLFNNPFKYVQQDVDLIAGVASIKNLVITGKLRRLWVRCQTTPRTISNIEFWADGQQRIEGQVIDINKRYRDYGFTLGDVNDHAVSFNIGTSNALKAAFNPINYFDAACIFDYDKRLHDALSIANSHELKLTSTVAQKARVYMECLPGNFV